MRRSLVVASALILGVASAALAATPEPAALCNTQTQPYNPKETIEQSYAYVKAKCHVGDVLQTTAQATYIIARLCDLTRSIVVTNGQLLCVVADAREERK